MVVRSKCWFLNSSFCPMAAPFTGCEGGWGHPQGLRRGCSENRACGHHESPISLLSQAIKRRKAAAAGRTQGAIRLWAPVPGGILWHVSNHLVEINCDFPGELCQQQQGDHCTLLPVHGREGVLCKGATRGHRSSHLQHFCLSKNLFSVGYCHMGPVAPLSFIQRGHSKLHPSAPTMFANLRFTTFGCKPQLIQELLAHHLQTVAKPVSCRFKLLATDLWQRPLHCS